MLRLLVVIVSLGLVAAFPVLAQQMQQHALSAPDTLNVRRSSSGSRLCARMIPAASPCEGR